MQKLAGPALIMIALLLCGCVDSTKINRNFQSVLNKIERQNERIRALENALRQLQEQMLDLSDREKETRTRLNNLPASQPGQAAAPAGVQVEYNGLAVRASERELLTRDGFIARVERMQPEKVKEWLGNPDQVKEGKNSQKWTYNSVVVETADGGQTNYAALMLIEGERVSRVVLFNPIQYTSRPGKR